ncbi:LuxR family transcriptional regulator, partial [Salmonella enterica]|nr:LuxR family transcriptional regulator [Salmonella enterica]
ILKHQGFNQFETAQILKTNHCPTMTKQGVSKALASVREEFYI